MGLPYRAVDKEGRTADFLLSKGVTWKPPSLFPGNKATRSPSGYHPGRVRRLTSSRRRIESLRHLTGPATDPLLQVREQRYRTRPSPDQTANPADALIQTIRDGGRDDPRQLP